MPYVEGFGTWPFGEEWLWEAIATSYLPLLRVLDERPGRVTLSLTPVLADQLAAPGVPARFVEFMRTIRPASHRLDLGAHPEVADQLERSAARYASAADEFEERGGDLLAAFAPHVRWTSAATHAVLPLLATDAGVRLQLHTGIASHRARFGGWGGGLWLPECAHAPWLDPQLEEAGVRIACVDLSDLGVDPRTPLCTPAGPVLAPIDRSIVDLVWSPAGYPSADAYLDTHNLTERRHQAWAVDGSPYDAERARAQLREHAADFAARVGERLASGGWVVCALDTELLGHWWPEGVFWLAAALDALDAAGIPVVPLDDAVDDAVPLERELPVTTWGEPRDLETWSGPGAHGLAWRQRAAELAVLGKGSDPSPRALRELLALQASDWAFLASRGTAGPYPLERAAGHEQALQAALAGDADPALRALAPWIVR
jgi:1,4-alpha-glucan branching enzyme